MAVMPFCILSAQTGNPQSAYSLEFVNTDSVKAGGVLPSNHFWLVNRSSGKRTQVKPVDFFTTIKTLGIVLKTQELH